jgi:hypothetical protein
MNTLALPKHMRIAALQVDYEGGAAQTLKVPALWQEFGFNCEQLFHTHAELYTAIYEREKHETILKTYLQEAEKRGLRIILYMNCHVLNPSQADRAADWAIVDEHGAYSRCYNTYLMNCMNSPWMDYFFRLLEDLKPFPMCGIFFDGPVLRPCSCVHCRRKFQMQHGAALADASPAEKAAFAMATYLDGKRAMYRKVKEINPGWIAYFNEDFADRSLDEIKACLACNDLVGTEGGFQFYQPPKEALLWRCGLQARILEAIAGGKPTVIFWAGDQKSWAWYLHTPAESKTTYATIAANGANAWYGIHSSTDILRGATGDAVKEAFHFDRDHEALYQDTESIAPVAVFYSFDSVKHYPTSREESDFYGKARREDAKAAGNYEASLQGAVATLFHGNEPFDVVTEVDLDRLDRYGVVLLPTAACMREETGRRLAEYVERGGVLIADSETGLFDEMYNKRANFLMADLFGVDFKGYRTYDRFDFGELGDEFRQQFKDGVLRIPAPYTAIDVAVREGTDVLARLCPKQAGPLSGKPKPAEYPFVMHRKFGKGAVYYLAACYFEFYGGRGIVHYRRMIDSIIHRHLPDRYRVLGAPPSLEVTVRRCRVTGKTLVHLVNFSGGMTRPIDHVIPLHDLRLRVPGQPVKATALVADRALAVCGNDVTLCPIHHFEVVVLEG